MQSPGAVGMDGARTTGAAATRLPRFTPNGDIQKGHDMFMQRTRTRSRWPATMAGALLLAALAPVASGQSITLTPANSIQAAINSDLYSEIILEPGIYNQVIDLGGIDGNPRPPLTLRSTDPDNPAVVELTVLDGQFLNAAVITCPGNTSDESVINGLKIINGLSTDRGGGIWINDCSPAISNCLLMNNEATVYGGAVYTNLSTSAFTNCTMEGNMADRGGAMYLNASTITVDRCTFTGNEATDPSGGGGGGIRAASVNLTVLDSTFTMNTAGDFGGGITATNGSLLVERSWFEMNAADRGGAVRTLNGSSDTIANSVFLGNMTGAFGTIYCQSPVSVRGCSFYGNDTAGAASVVLSIASGGAGTQFINSIAWGNTPMGATQIDGGDAAASTVAYSVVEGGYGDPEDANLDVDPMFVNAAAGDLRLLAGSAAIDAGDASAVPLGFPVDFDGNPRAVDDPDSEDTGQAVLGLSVDIGAFELQPDPPAPACAGDSNGDGTIDIVDLLALLSAWGACP